MRIEEAIEYFYNQMKRGLIRDDTQQEVYEIAISALEKQIPKKPIIKNWSPAYCPCCKFELSESVGDGYYLHQTIIKICDCGQKLNWD